MRMVSLLFTISPWPRGTAVRLLLNAGARLDQANEERNTIGELETPSADTRPKESF